MHMNRAPEFIERQKAARKGESPKGTPTEQLATLGIPRYFRRPKFPLISGRVVSLLVIEEDAQVCILHVY